MPSRRTLAVLLAVVAIAALAPLVIVPGWSGVEPASLGSPRLQPREMSSLQQGAQALAGLVIKPTYMLVSLLLIVALLPQKGTDMAALAWGQVAFLVGEAFCAINFYIYHHGSTLSEYLHSVGMVLSFGFTAYALAEALDTRLLKLTASPGACAAISVCRVCTRHESAGCKARKVALLVLPLAAILATVPLFAPLVPQAYSVTVMGVPYSYARLEPYEFLERRMLPILSILLLAAAWLPLLRRGEPPVPAATKMLASAGLGALGFSLFRVSLSALFTRELVWFEFWEESSELLFVAALAFIVFVFREALLTRPSALNILATNAE